MFREKASHFLLFISNVAFTENQTRLQQLRDTVKFPLPLTSKLRHRKWAPTDLEK